jgi:hypothetical protein
MRWFLALVLFTGCGDDPVVGAPDLSIDLMPQSVTLTDGNVTLPLDAWYSIFIAAEGGQVETHLVVTLIDPGFRCDGAATTTGLDAISFGFAARVVGVNAGYIIGRAGPHLGPLIGGGEGTAELTAVDDRFLDADGGAIIVAPGGMVAGNVRWKNGEVRVEGMFAAPHCAALDFAAAM